LDWASCEWQWPLQSAWPHKRWRMTLSRQRLCHTPQMSYLEERRWRWRPRTDPQIKLCGFNERLAETSIICLGAGQCALLAQTQLHSTHTHTQDTRCKSRPQKDGVLRSPCQLGWALQTRFSFVVVVVLAVRSWSQQGSMINDQASSAASWCLKGDDTAGLRVGGAQDDLFAPVL